MYHKSKISTRLRDRKLKFRKGKIIIHFDFIQDVILVLANILKRTLKYIKIASTKKNFFAIVVILGGTIGMYFGFDWTIESGFFCFFAIISYVVKWDARISIAAALACLISIMFLTIYGEYEIIDKDLTEKIAVWAYFFLVIGVFGQIIEFLWEKQPKSIPQQSYKFLYHNIYREDEVESRRRKLR